MISKEDRIFSGVVGYFPNALAAIGRWSAAANEKHNPGEPMHWAFGKSTAHLDAAMSHLTQAGRIDPETQTPHLVNAAWRVLAALETSLIEGGAMPGVNVRGAPSTPAAPPPQPERWGVFEGDYLWHGQVTELKSAAEARAEAVRIGIDTGLRVARIEWSYDLDRWVEAK